MSPYRHSVLLFVGALLLCSTTGCGGVSETPVDHSAVPLPGSNTSTVSAEPSTTQTDAAVGDSLATRRQNERWTDDNGVEYLGDVPLDVFFDEPLTIARNQTPLQGSTPAPPLANDSAQSPSMAAVADESAMGVVSGESGGGESAVVTSDDSWDSLISIDDLQNEITNARNFLNRSIQSYGDYKKVTLMIPGKAASIAVLASVAMEHPQEVNWKPDAIYVRDLARQMNEEPLQANKKDHTKVLGLFENIASTLDRSKPAGLAEPNADDSFADVAGMDMVMVRLDEAEKRLRTEAGSEAAFDAKKVMIDHEAAILATFSHVITLEAYGYADDEEFVGYANQIVQAAKGIRTATQANDFSSYELARSKVSTSCSDCHSAYRNN